MAQTFQNKLLALVFSGSLFISSAGVANAAESPLINQSLEQVKPELAAKYSYTEDGEFTKALNIPTYEWAPEGQPVKAVRRERSNSARNQSGSSSKP